jgi:hypothetical protein
MNSYVPEVRPLSRREIEDEALAVISRLYPKLLRKPGRFPVLDFWDRLKDDYGLEPAVEHLSDGVEGITWPDGRVVLSEETYRGAHNGEGRPRYTVPHECFHGIKHRDQIRSALVDAGEIVLYRRHLVKPFRDPEWQANAFSSAILMPACMVAKVLSNTPKVLVISRMMEEFGVSRRAAEVRLDVLERNRNQ